MVKDYGFETYAPNTKPKQIRFAKNERHLHRFLS